jgi:glycosyltransferase involved in cell wall biosynthesis
MNILYIANARIPTEKAHGIQIMKMCEAFAVADNEVELVIPRRINHIKECPFGYYGVRENFKITKLPCLDLIFLDKYIGHLGMWVESFTFNISVFCCLLFKKVDIIYTRDKFLLPFVLFKKNIVFEVHAFPKNYFLYERFIKRCKKIITITQGLKNLFIKKEVNENNILVAPDGVDFKKFNISLNKEECRKKLNLPTDKKIVLYTGHLYRWKGVDVLAEASKFLPENYLVYFVGGTEEDIKKFKFRYSKLESIQVIGHRPYSEIPCWLKAADVLVLPNSKKEEISREWTSPIKLFEYMASSRPIVASDLPSIREILNKNNSILVEPDDPGSLANGIKEVLEIPSLSHNISDCALREIKKYTWQERAKKISKFINNN